MFQEFAIPKYLSSDMSGHQIHLASFMHCELMSEKTRPNTQLPQSHAAGQGPYLRSVKHLGRSSMAKDSIIAEKVKCDGWMDGLTDKAGCRVA